MRKTILTFMMLVGAHVVWAGIPDSGIGSPVTLEETKEILSNMKKFRAMDSVIGSPDMNYTDLHQAADNCDFKTVKSVFKASHLNTLDREGYTPLAYAARGGCLDVVKFLTEKKAVIDAAEEHLGWTALMHAAAERHTDIVHYLLSQGANPNSKAGIGQTALTAAIQGTVFSHGPQGERDETIKTLLKQGANINLQGEFGWTPLTIAVFKEDTTWIQFLLNNGADVAIKDGDGKTALDHAKERKLAGIVDILESKAPAAAGGISQEKYDELYKTSEKQQETIQYLETQVRHLNDELEKMRAALGNIHYAK